MKRTLETTILLAAAALASLGLHAAPGFADARLHVQVDLPNITPQSLPLYLEDARAAGADAVQIAVCDFFKPSGA